MRGAAALAVLERLEFGTTLDIGSGQGKQAAALRAQGRDVTTISLEPPADIVGDYLTYGFKNKFSCVWACHVLEHQPNANLFLKKCFHDLEADGLLAVTVPPLKHEIVGGHVSLWNAGLLLYHLILAGFDCSAATIRIIDYDISVIVKKKYAELPALRMDGGDIDRLAPFFPVPVSERFNGEMDGFKSWL